MSWLLLTIISAITGSISRILQKVLLKSDQSDPFAFGAIFQVLVAALFLVYSVASQTLEFPNLSSVWLNVCAMVILYSLANLSIFTAFKYAEASEVSIILATSTIWSAITAFFMLSEKLSTKNVFGILLILTGVAAVNYTKAHWKLSKGHLFALVGALLLGIAFVNDVYVIGKYTSISSYMVIAFALPGLFTLVYSPKSVKNLHHFIQYSVLKKLLLCAVFYALSAITIFTAYKLGGLASVISPIQQTSIIFTVIFSYVFLREKDRIPNKIIGTIFAFLGVLLLV